MRVPASLLAAALMLLGMCNAARADMTVVSETTISTTPPAGSATSKSALVEPYVSTFYYKDGHKRADVRGSVVLTGGPDGKIYTLNPAAKTYYVTAPGAAANSMVQINAKAVVSPGGNKKTLLGHSANDYKFEAEMAMHNGDPSQSRMMPTIHLHGVIWATPAIHAPNIDNLGEAMTKFMPPQLQGGMKQMVSEFAKVKGFPLLQDMYMDLVFPKNSPMATSAPHMFQGMSVRTRVKSILEAPIAAALFVIPADYKQVDASTAHMPGMPGSMR